MNHSSLGVISAFCSSITWALGVTAYSHLSKKYAPATINFSRVILSLPAFFVLTLIFHPESFGVIQQNNWLWIAVSTIASFALGDVVFLFSAMRIGVPGALALAATYILWSSLAGVWFQGDVLDSLQMLGVGIILLGSITVILSGYHLKKGSTRDYFIGVLLGLLTSLFWALNTFALSEGGKNLPTFTVNMLRMFVAIILIPIVGIIMKQKFTWFIGRDDFRKSGWAMMLEALGGSTLFAYGLTHAPLSIAAPLSSLAPVLTVPMAWIQKTEPVSIPKLMGVLMVCSGIALLLKFSF